MKVRIFLVGCLLLPIKAFAFTGTIMEEDYINCFPEGLQEKSGELIHCEASAVVYDGRNVILASDHAVPGERRSPVFAFPFRYTPARMNTKPLLYLRSKPFREAKKIEDFSISPDKQFIFATTSFHRHEMVGEKDLYSMLLFWPAGEPDKVMTVYPPLKVEIPSPYFKVEGLAVLPEKTLLFGIREVGKTYKKFNYTIQLVSVSYQQKAGQLILKNDFKVIYDLNPERLPIPEEVGLSSIEFNPFDNSLYLLTSFEIEKKGEKRLGGYLWKLPLEDLYSQNPPKPVLNQHGEPLRFSHKSEGITILDQNTVLILHDDDRTLLEGRQPHQAPYSIVRIEDR